MRYRHLFSLYALIAALAFYRMASGEHAVGDAAGGRYSASVKLDEPMIAWLATATGLEPEYLRKGYTYRLPQGIESSIQRKQEDGAAGAIGDLLSVVHEGQALDLLESLPTPSCEAEEAPNTSRREALLKRLAWAAEWILKTVGKAPATPSCDTPAKARFLAVLKDVWDKITQRKEEFYRDLALARDNRQARDALLAKYDPKWLLSWGLKQAESGNSALAEDIVHQLSFPSPEGDVLDVTAPDGAEHRIVLGKDRSRSVDAVRDFAASHDGMAGYSIAQNQHGSPEVFHSPLLSAPEGSSPGTGVGIGSGLAVGGGTGTGSGSGRGTGTGSGTGGAGGAGTPRGTGGEGGGGTEPAPPSESPSSPGPIFVRTCIDCHGPSSGRPFRIDGAGNSIGTASAETIHRRVVVRKNMPPDGTPGFGEDDRAAIERWLQSQGVR